MRNFILFLIFQNFMLAQVNQWKVFKSENSSVPFDSFYCIGIDTADNIWLAAHAVCVWDKNQSNCYFEYPYLGSDIVAIHGDSTGYVWLSLESHWIIKTNGISWETKFLDNAMGALTIDKNNTLWGGGGLRNLVGLHKFDGNIWTVFDTSNSLLPYPLVSQITSDSNGKIWGIAIGANHKSSIFGFDGINWQIIPQILPPVSISTMAVDKKGNIWYATAIPQTSFSGIVQVNDTFTVFHPKPDSVPGDAQKLLIDSNDNLWVCWYNCISEYSNQNWTLYRDTSEYSFSDMIIDSKNNIWLSTWRDGVIAFNKNGLVLSNDISDKSNILDHFDIDQNYPNPFNPTTKISWQSPVAGYQTLKVFDVLGNEVATLINEYRNAGSYEIDFDGSKLSSGVYFYQLKAGDFLQTKKMILIK